MSRPASRATCGSTRSTSSAASSEAGLRARHNLSQNFLADVDVLEGILREADPAPERAVLEIGPGLGFLTGGLLAAGAPVTAVELDRGLVAAAARDVRGRAGRRGAADRRGRRAGPGPRQPVPAAVRRGREHPVPHHEPDPAPPAGRARRARSGSCSWSSARSRSGSRPPRATCPTCRCSASTTRRRGSRSGSRARRSSPRPRSSRRSSSSSRIPATTASTRRAEDRLWRVVQAGVPRAAQDAPQRARPPAARSTRDRVDAALDGVRHRPRPAPADRRGGGVARPRRGARATIPGEDAAVTDRPGPPPGARRPARAGQGQPHARGARARGRTGIHDLHSVMVPLDLADRLSVSVAPPGARGHPPRDGPRPRAARGQPRAARDRGRPRGRAARLGPPGAAAAARRPARQADPGRRGARRAARPTPPRPPTPRSRRGA